MGNIGSSGGSARRERRRRSSGRQNNNPDGPHPPAHPPFPASSSPSSAAADLSANRYVFASPPPPTTTTAAGYPTGHYPNPQGPLYYQYPGHPPAPLEHHHHHHHHWVGGYMAAPPPPPPQQHQEGFSLVKRQKAVTIRNDVNLKKETLRMEPDELNPGCFLVSFTFDATVTGRISIYFFAREGENCSLTPANASVGRLFTATFKEGIGQKFRQPAGSGISSATLEEAERSVLQRDDGEEVYALAVKAEGSPPPSSSSGGGNSLITQAALERREKGGSGWEARVVKQVLWVDGTRYELQEIYGIGGNSSSLETDFDGNDPAKECVICLSEPRDTTVLPCRHMCMCSECAKVLGLQTNRCPICRQPIERLLEIKVNGGSGGDDSPPLADEKH